MNNESMRALVDHSIRNGMVDAIKAVIPRNEPDTRTIPFDLLTDEFSATFFHLRDLIRDSRVSVADTNSSAFSIADMLIKEYTARLKALRDLAMYAGFETEKMAMSSLISASWKVWEGLRCERRAYLVGERG